MRPRDPRAMSNFFGSRQQASPQQGAQAQASPQAASPARPFLSPPGAGSPVQDAASFFRRTSQRTGAPHSPRRRVPERPPNRRPSSGGSPDLARNVTCRRGKPDAAAASRVAELEGENVALKREIEALRLAVARSPGSAFFCSPDRDLAQARAEEQAIPPPRPDLGQQMRRLTKEKRRRHMLRDSIMHTVEEDEGGGGLDGQRSTIRVTKEKISRQASIGTARVLHTLPATPRAGGMDLLLRVVAVFREPLRSEHTEYLGSSRFADDLLELSARAGRRFEAEPRVLRLESPAYVFGDTHGNLEDLHFFSDHIWKLGVSLTAGSLVFLGDYVDRGLSSLEVVAYLFALKCLEPAKVWLLRGNHETRDVNGWKEHYGDRSFLWQCEHRFGPQLGPLVWEGVNAAFDRLPLAALVDDDIFCIHGGIPRRPPPGPRPFCADADAKTRLELLDMGPKVITINPPDVDADPALQQMASECLWSDPAQEDQEDDLGDSGYGESLRGGGTVCFGMRAIEDFLEETGCSFIMRAHEAHAYGVNLSKGATVFTIFSTSKDHHQGRMAMCGCILVDIEKIQVINRSPHYRNHYVHKRNSMSLIGLPQSELAKRKNLGLVVDECDDSDDEAFEEADEYDDDELLYNYDDPTSQFRENPVLGGTDGP